jgi:hypothetical protein
LFIDNIGSVSCLTVLFVCVVRFGFVVVVTVRDAPRVLYGLVIDTPKAVGNNDVMVQETPEMCTATPVTPVTVKKSEHSIDDTPVNTVVKKSECSTDDTPVNTVEESPPTTSRKSRTSVFHNFYKSSIPKLSIF